MTKGQALSALAFFIFKMLWKLFKILLLCILFISCLHTRDSSVVYHNDLEHLPKFPVTIYIDNDIPKKFDEEIINAFNSWEKASGNKLKFNLIFNIIKPGYFKEYEKVENSPYFIWLFSKYNHKHLEYKELMEGWLAMHSPFNGNRNIVLFTEFINEKTDKNLMYRVVLHEVGHFLGLKHNNKISTMNHKIENQPGCITKMDAYDLCKIYNCIPHHEC